MGVDIPMRRSNFEEKRTAYFKVYRLSAVICAKTAEPIKIHYSSHPVTPHSFIPGSKLAGFTDYTVTD